MNELQEDIIGKKKNPWKIIGKVISIVFTLFILTVSCFLIQFEIRYEDFKVEGASMQPTLNEQGELKSDIVYVNKYADVKHRDIVVLEVEKTDETEYWVKRVIALSGDEIDIVGVGNQISAGTSTVPPKYFDYAVMLKKKGESEARVLNEDYLAEENARMEIKFNQFWKYKKDNGLPFDEPLKLADDEFFAMGDNRLNSTDSAVKGPFKISVLVGRVDFITKYGLSDKDKQLKKLSYVFTLKF